MGWDFNVGLMPYSDRWRARRKLFHQVLHGRAAASFQGLQSVRAVKLLQKIYRKPEDIAYHLRQSVFLILSRRLLLTNTWSSYAASIAITVAYGRDLALENDPLISIAEKSVEMLSEAVFTGAVVVNALPSRACSLDMSPATRNSKLM